MELLKRRMVLGENVEDSAISIDERTSTSPYKLHSYVYYLQLTGVR